MYGVDMKTEVDTSHIFQHYLYVFDVYMEHRTMFFHVYSQGVENDSCVLYAQVGYHFTPSGKSYPDNWIITDIVYETEGGNLQTRSVIVLLLLLLCYFCGIL